MKLSQIVGRRSVHVSVIKPPYDIDMYRFSGQKKLLCGKGDFIYDVKEWEGNESEVTCRQCLRIIKNKDIIDSGIEKYIEFVSKQKTPSPVPISTTVRGIMIELGINKNLYKKLYEEILDINKKLRKNKEGYEKSI